MEARYKSWTFGEDNTVTLGCLEARPEDEGDYKVEDEGDYKVEHGRDYKEEDEGYLRERTREIIM